MNQKVNKMIITIGIQRSSKLNNIQTNLSQSEQYPKIEYKKRTKYKKR